MLAHEAQSIYRSVACENNIYTGRLSLFSVLLLLHLGFYSNYLRIFPLSDAL